jgi:hypothetical protein
MGYFRPLPTPLSFFMFYQGDLDMLPSILGCSLGNSAARLRLRVLSAGLYKQPGCKYSQFSRQSNYNRKGRVSSARVFSCHHRAVAVVCFPPLVSNMVGSSCHRKPVLLLERRPFRQPNAPSPRPGIIIALTLSSSVLSSSVFLFALE